MGRSDEEVNVTYFVDGRNGGWTSGLDEINPSSPFRAAAIAAALWQQHFSFISVSQSNVQENLSTSIPSLFIVPVYF